MSAQRIGEIVAGRYQIVRLIGEGGMGTVYEVIHLKLNRSFALKALSPAMIGSEQAQQALARFHREAKAVASLRHPNVVEVIDFETMDDGSPCMVLEFLRGEDLAARLERTGPLQWDEIASIADQTTSALQVAHAAGIIHRDLKPHNIFLAHDDTGREHVKLLDFGVSKMRDTTATTITRENSYVGTPAYMSPEQAEGHSADVGPSTDVWAMGAIIYEMATGKLAFFATNTPSTLFRICFGAPDPITSLRRDTPDAWAALVDRVLTRNPADRITTIEQLRDGIRHAVSAPARSPSTLRLPATPAPARSPSPRTPVIAVSRPPAIAVLPPDAITVSPAAMRRWLPITLGCAVVAAIAVGLIGASGRGGAAESRTAMTSAGRPTEAAPREPASAPSSAPAAATGPAPALAAASPSASDSPAAPTPIPTPPEPVAPAVTASESPRDRIIEINLKPTSARVFFDGKPLKGRQVTVPLDGARHALRVEAAGYRTRELVLDAQTPAVLSVDLHRKSSESPAPVPVPARPTPIPL